MFLKIDFHRAENENKCLFEAHLHVILGSLEVGIISARTGAGIRLGCFVHIMSVRMSLDPLLGLVTLKVASLVKVNNVAAANSPPFLSWQEVRGQE